MRLTTSTLLATAFAMIVGTADAASLQSQYGILDLTANGGINPSTGVAWQAGDKYRLAFHTNDTINGVSNDPGVYDAFATAQAQQRAELATSTGWTAMVWVNTEAGVPQAADFNNIQPGESQVSNPADRGGYADTTGGSGIGGAGVGVFAMDGTTAIARNNADIFNNWSNPFNGDSQVRLAAGTFNLDSDGNSVEASQNVHYSPFLDQFGLGDTANIHGASNWTGGWGNPVNPLGDNVDPGRTDKRASYGSSNANNGGRTWNRFQTNVTSNLNVYAISEELTVTEIPEPSSLALLGLGGLLIARRRRG